ncbi:MAG TPA: hypothetical protein VJ914_05625 [Pseudonocardiaceae bacterium]|nr:hypothetical protein [Pseudonocardiaceae bacterium]
MPPAIDGLVLPNTDGLAIDDEYTRITYDALNAQRRNQVLRTVALVLLTAALAALAPYSPFALAAAIVALVRCIAYIRITTMLFRALPIQHRLITHYPWRPATLTGVQRRAIRVEVGGETEYLLPAKLTHGETRRGRVNHEQLWLCGPDDAGRVRVRVAGQVISYLYQRLAEPPTGAFAMPQPPALRPSRVSPSRALIAPGCVIGAGVFVAIEGVRAPHPYLPLAIGGTAIGLGLLVVARFALRLPYLRSIRQRMANQPVTVPLRLTSVSPGPALRVRAEAEFDAPDGRALTLRMPKAKLGLIANLRAGAPAELYGELAPGRSVTIVIAGQEHTRTRAHVALR